MKVIFVGEIYHADLSIGGGPIIGGPPAQPPGIWGPPGPWPTPPIAWPQPPVDPGYGHPIAPPGFWPGTPPPRPQPQPPGIWGPPSPMPTPPFHPGGQPPGIWGGGNVPMPTPPIWIPMPMPPGGSGAHPEHPIYYPPTIWPDPPQKPQPGEPPIEAKVIWTPATGWGVVFVPTEGTELPTPSGAPAPPKKP